MRIHCNISGTQNMQCTIQTEADGSIQGCIIFEDLYMKNMRKVSLPQSCLPIYVVDENGLLHEHKYLSLH